MKFKAFKIEFFNPRTLYGPLQFAGNLKWNHFTPVQRNVGFLFFKWNLSLTNRCKLKGKISNGIKGLVILRKRRVFLCFCWQNFAGLLFFFYLRFLVEISLFSFEISFRFILCHLASFQTIRLLMTGSQKHQTKTRTLRLRQELLHVNKFFRCSFPKGSK